MLTILELLLKVEEASEPLLEEGLEGVAAEVAEVRGVDFLLFFEEGFDHQACSEMQQPPQQPQERWWVVSVW